MTTLSDVLPWQNTVLKRMQDMGYKATKRFQLVPGITNLGMGHPGMGFFGLMIEDFAWWMDNERDILNWMVDNLLQGIEHQQGMFVYMPTEQDRMMFLLKWGG